MLGPRTQDTARAHAVVLGTLDETKRHWPRPRCAHALISPASTLHVRKKQRPCLPAFLLVGRYVLITFHAIVELSLVLFRSLFVRCRVRFGGALVVSQKPLAVDGVGWESIET